MEIVEQVKSLIDSYLEQNGIELVDIMYRREQAGMTLRLLCDTLSGITIAECEAVNNYLSGVLDKENIIDEHYVIEVSSPGLDRPITTDRDFTRSMDKVLEITTYEPIDSRKTHEGKLLGMDKDSIIIENNGISVVIPKTKIARARLSITIV